MNKELDNLIIQLDKSGASDDEIQTVVNDYKTRMQPKLDAISSGAESLNKTLQRDFIPFSQTAEKGRQYATLSNDETIANVNERTTALTPAKIGVQNPINAFKIIPNAGEDLWQIAKFGGNILKDLYDTIAHPVETWNKGFSGQTVGQMTKSLIEDPSLLAGSAGSEIASGVVGTVAKVADAKGAVNKIKAGVKGIGNTISGTVASFENDPILSLPIFSIFKRGITAPIKDIVNAPKDIVDVTTKTIDAGANKFNTAKELFNKKGAEKMLDEKVKVVDDLIASKQKHADISNEIVNLRDTALDNREAMDIRKINEEKRINDLISKDRGFTEFEAHALRAEKSDVTPQSLLDTVKKLSDENYEGYKSGYSSILDERVVTMEPVVKALKELEITARETGNQGMYQSIKNASNLLATKDAVVDAVSKFGNDVNRISDYLESRKDGTYESFIKDPTFYLENPFTLDSLKGVRETLKSSIKTNTNFDLVKFNETVGKAVENIIKEKLSPDEYKVYEKSQEKFRLAINDPILKAIEKGNEKNIVSIIEKNMDSAKRLDRELGTDILDQYHDIKANEVIEKSMDENGTINSKKLGSNLKKEKLNLSKEDFNYISEVYQNLVKNEKIKTSFETINKIVEESTEYSGRIDPKKLSYRLEKAKKDLLPEDYKALRESTDRLLEEEKGMSGIDTNLKKLGNDSKEVYENLKKIDTEDGLSQAVMTTGKTPRELGELMIENAIQKVDTEIGKTSENFDIENIDALIKEIEGIGGKSSESQKVVNELFGDKESFVKELKQASFDIKQLKEIKNASMFKRIASGIFGVALVKYFPMTGMRYLSESVGMEGINKTTDIGRTRKSETKNTETKSINKNPLRIGTGASTQPDYEEYKNAVQDMMQRELSPEEEMQLQEQYNQNI